MPYLLSVIIAIGVIACAIVLVAWVQRVGNRTKMTLAGVTLLAGIGLNFLMEGDTSASFEDALPQVLTWTYASLTMFAGQGSVDVVDSLITPDGLPRSLLEVLRYALQVFAFLFAIAVIVAAVAKRFADQVWLFFSRPQSIYVLYGHSDDAVELAARLSQRAGSSPSAMVVLLSPNYYGRDDRDRLLRQDVRIFPHASSVLKKARNAPACHVVWFDDGDPAFVDEFRAQVGEVCDVFAGRHAVGHVFVRSAWARDRVGAITTEAIDIHTFDRPELIARDAVRVAAPHTLVGGFAEGRPDRALRVVIAGDRGPVTERLIQHLVMNATFLAPTEDGDPRPLVQVFTPTACEGEFRVRFPDAHLSADVRFHVSVPGDPDFYSLIAEAAPSLICLSFGEQAESLTQARLLSSSFRRSDVRPRILVHSDADAAEDDDVRFFGRTRDVLSPATFIDEAQDVVAKQVNAFYHKDKTSSPDKLWAQLPYLHRASSRASADFHPALKTVWASVRALPNGERLVGETEHLRWMAFYRLRGYTAMSTEEFCSRMADSDELDIDVRGKVLRDDQVGKQHLCLVPWDELNDLDAMFTELGAKDPTFQAKDIDVVKLVTAMDERST